jgi:hypothetical protein
VSALSSGGRCLGAGHRKLQTVLSLFSVVFVHSLYVLLSLINSSFYCIGNDKWRAIDSAIGREGFKVILLLRITPLFPFSIVNYLYGLTSVNFWLVYLVSVSFDRQEESSSVDHRCCPETKQTILSVVRPNTSLLIVLVYL